VNRSTLARGTRRSWRGRLIQLLIMDSSLRGVQAGGQQVAAGPSGRRRRSVTGSDGGTGGTWVTVRERHGGGQRHDEQVSGLPPGVRRRRHDHCVNGRIRPGHCVLGASCVPARSARPESQRRRRYKASRARSRSWTTCPTLARRSTRSSRRRAAGELLDAQTLDKAWERFINGPTCCNGRQVRSLTYQGTCQSVCRRTTAV